MPGIADRKLLIILLSFLIAIRENVLFAMMLKTGDLEYLLYICNGMVI